MKPRQKATFTIQINFSLLESRFYLVRLRVAERVFSGSTEGPPD